MCYFITVADIRFKNTLDVFDCKYVAAIFSLTVESYNMSRIRKILKRYTEVIFLYMCCNFLLILINFCCSLFFLVYLTKLL